MCRQRILSLLCDRNEREREAEQGKGRGFLRISMELFVVFSVVVGDLERQRRSEFSRIRLRLRGGLGVRWEEIEFI